MLLKLIPDYAAGIFRTFFDDACSPMVCGLIEAAPPLADVP
jgi:hypothetical protein